MIETMPAPASPYDEPELYDLLMEGLEFDVPFLLETSREGAGPVLELGCGTGRVLLRLAAAGVDVEGIEPSDAMRARLEDKARARGLAVRVARGDMRSFAAARRYARVLCPFNAFSHMLTQDDQLAALRAMRACLLPGGAAVVHQSQLSADAWSRPREERVLEMETPAPTPGHVLRIYDTRTKDRAEQTQHSIVDVEESDAQGRLVRAFRSETRHRWAYRHELELLLRLAGFARVEVRGDGGHGAVTPESAEMWAIGWTAPAGSEAR